MIATEDSPMVLFIWGPSRVVPVLVTSFSVTEEAFDQQLNPIQAKVDLDLKVLSNMDLKEKNIGYGVYTANLARKKVLARLNTEHHIEQFTGKLSV